MVIDRVCGVLVVLCWKSAVFWPFLCPSGVFIPQVVDWIDLLREKQFYIKCKTRKEYGNADLHFKMLALRIDFKKGVNYCV